VTRSAQSRMRDRACARLSGHLASANSPPARSREAFGDRKLYSLLTRRGDAAMTGSDREGPQRGRKAAAGHQHRGGADRLLDDAHTIPSPTSPRASRAAHGAA